MTSQYENKIVSPQPRYANNALWWFLHDVVVHPLTGILGCTGRLFRSYRLMALAHHIHNATAPSNDVMADYAEACYRAGCNETKANPMGSSTPDEQYWNRTQAVKAAGLPEGTHLDDQQVEDIQKKHGLVNWNTQSSGGKPPTIVTIGNQSTKIAEMERHLKTIVEVLESVLDARTKHEIKHEMRRRGYDI